MKPVVETQGLTKRYGHLMAVDHLDLEVREAEIYGFLGPNGSGKTTTILMLLGLTEPTSGWARVDGFDPLREPLQVKRLVGYLPENVGFYGDLTARQNLRYTASLNDLPPRGADRRIEGLLEQVGLAEAADRPVGQFSRGMRQRLGIADVLLKSPRLVYLDDPTVGLDPEGVQELLQLIVRMSREEGITVFLSSHLLHQVQRICDRLAILFQGRKVAEGTMEELRRAEGPAFSLEVEVDQATPELLEALEGLEGVRQVSAAGPRLTLACEGDLRGPVAQAVLGHGRQLLLLRGVDRSLEEIYLRYFQAAEAAATP